MKVLARVIVPVTLAGAKHLVYSHLVVVVCNITSIIYFVSFNRKYSIRDHQRETCVLKRKILLNRCRGTIRRLNL